MGGEAWLGFDFDCKKMDNHVLSYDDIFRRVPVCKSDPKSEKGKNEGVWNHFYKFKGM